jgi:hypothetical protein
VKAVAESVLKVLAPPKVCVPAVTAPAVVFVALAIAMVIFVLLPSVQVVPVTEEEAATSWKLASIAAEPLTVTLS